MAKDVESQGAMGVVLNAPISDLNLLAVSNAVDIPVIITVTHEGTDIASRLQHGAAILNIACGKETPNVVRKILGVSECSAGCIRWENQRKHLLDKRGRGQRYYLYAALDAGIV